MNRNKERQASIIRLLEKQGEVAVVDLVRQLAVSEVTIRKDLAALERQGVLVRRYGGARALSAPVTASAHKLAIARRAALLIDKGARVLIDSGTTTSALIPQMEGKEGLVVMTNSLAAAQMLLQLRSQPTLLMTGGTWDGRSAPTNSQSKS